MKLINFTVHDDASLLLPERSGLAIQVPAVAVASAVIAVLFAACFTYNTCAAILATVCYPLLSSASSLCYLLLLADLQYIPRHTTVVHSNTLTTVLLLFSLSSSLCLQLSSS